MAIVQKILNLDSYFRSTDGDKIIINDLKFFSKLDNEKLNNSLMTVYNNAETLSIKPSCDCGKVVGVYMVGKLCSDCGTVCQESFKKVKPLLWLKALTPELKFLNPTVWLMITTLFSKQSASKITIDYLRYFCDSRYNPEGKNELPSHVAQIYNFLGGVRTYENTMSKLVDILKFMLSLSRYKDQEKQHNISQLITLITNNKDDIFTNYLPIVNKKLFVVENTTKGKFINLASSDIINCVKTWLKACSEENLSEKMKSSVTGTVISNLARLYHTYYNDYVVKKEGMLRKHVYGARSHFTFRCVIVSISGQHNYDEVIAPWCVATSAFRPHILNKLVKRGYSYKNASNILFRAVKKFNPEIYDILNELIEETPGKGIEILTQRNPSLFQGSMQKVYITKFNNNPSDVSFKISSLIAKHPNADFDGDELNQTILLDNLVAKEVDTFKPHYNIPDVSKPYAISGNFGLLGPSNSILTNFLDDKNCYDNSEDEIVKQLKFIDI